MVHFDVYHELGDGVFDVLSTARQQTGGDDFDQKSLTTW